MTDRQSLQKFLLGTAVRITVILSIDTATSAKITIDDPSENIKVNNADMTKEADKVYSYVYQSLSTHDDGDYVATVSVVSGGYTSVEQSKFTLVDQE